LVFNAEGDLFYTDNQGPWNGACKLQQIVPGAFLGHPDGLKWFDKGPAREAIVQAGLKKPAQPQDKSRLYLEAKKIPELLPPSVYYPYPKMGQSAGGFAVDPTDDKFGPFKNQLFVGDQTQSIVMRTTLEKIDGHYQGACYPFRSGLIRAVSALNSRRTGRYSFTVPIAAGARGAASHLRCSALSGREKLRSRSRR
jgi:hypothetical protein